MEQIVLSEEDFNLLKEKYTDLIFNKSDNTISGVLSFRRSYNEKVISGKYSVDFKLERSNDSILPKVRETEGKILNIVKRKNKSREDLHLNSDDGELCLIFPLKEKEFYPNGFEFNRFMNHLEEHFYWITFFDRYDKKPWEDEPHSGEAALFKAAKENKLYRKELNIYISKIKKKENIVVLNSDVI